MITGGTGSQGEFVVDVITAARRDLKTGYILIGIGGVHCYGVTENYEESPKIACTHFYVSLSTILQKTLFFNRIFEMCLMGILLINCTVSRICFFAFKRESQSESCKI